MSSLVDGHEARLVVVCATWKLGDRIWDVSYVWKAIDFDEQFASHSGLFILFGFYSCHNLS